MRKIPAIYLLHGPETEAAARYFMRLLGERFGELKTEMRLLPWRDADVSENKIAALADEMVIPHGVLLVGFRDGGLVAAKMQERRPDMHVFAINAPARLNGVTLRGRQEQRFALHSAAHSRQQDMASWAQAAEAYDVRWVYARHMVVRLIAAYIAGAEVADEAARISETLENSSRPRGPIPAAFLLHGKGGSPAGSVSKFEAALAQHWPGIEYARPLLPHHDPEVLAERSVDFLQTIEIPQSSVLIGISLGGLVAACFQEQARPDLQVICINSPTWADGVRLKRRVENRVAIYSSRDGVIAGRTAEWPDLAEAYDYPWLTHDTDPHMQYLVRLIDWYIEGRLAGSAERVRDVPRTRQEIEDEWWRTLVERKIDDRPIVSKPGRPANYRDIGVFDAVWEEFLDGFYRLKQAEFFAAEPPAAIGRKEQARLAGIAEFLCNRFCLTQPAWVNKAEYFLDEEYDVLSEQGTGAPQWRYLRMAGTPRELLRRRVIWESRWLVRA